MKRTVTVEKPQDGGFGIALIGPKVNEQRTGVYISKSKNKKIPAGERIISINAISMVGATQLEAHEMIMTSDEITLVLITDHEGLVSLDNAPWA